MPFNGNGVFSRVMTWVTDATNGIPMTPSRFDQDANDMAAGLSLCLTRNGQSTPTANLPMGGFKLTGLAAGANAGDSITYDQVAGAAGSALLGYNQGASGAVARTVQAKLRETVSVKDFGAVGDGVTDDTAAIQAALTYLSYTTYQGSIVSSYAKGGGTLIFPPGTYKVTSTLYIGSNTRIIGYGPTGSTSSSVTTNMGARIVAAFSSLNAWVFSSATIDLPGQTYSVYNRQYSGADATSGNVTLCQGISIEGLVINGGGAYGGIRLLCASECDVRNCIVYNAGVGYFFNASYGFTYSRLYAQTGLHGLAIVQCNAFTGDHVYADFSASGWTQTTSTTLVNQSDIGTGGFLPSAAWTTYRYGVYVGGCLNVTMTATTSEHWDCGFAGDHSQFSLLTGYFEANTFGNLAFVTCTGQFCVFANTVSSGSSYLFGVNNSLKMMDGCSYGTIYVGNAQNSVTVGKGDSTVASDWTWSDSLTYTELNGTFNVSAAGTTTAVLGSVTFDEAMRRISVSSQRDWTIYIANAASVSTASQLTIQDKRILFTWAPGSSTKPTINAGAAGGGFIFRWSMDGNVALKFLNVNVSFPTGTTGATGDQALINSSGSLNLDLTMNNVVVNQGAAYSLLGTFANTSMNLRAAFSTCGITSTSPAPLLRSTGSAVTTSIQANTTMDANIKALGTNGLQGTVVSSNFV